MEIVRKKYIFIFLLLIELTSLFLMYKSNQNKKIILDNVSLKENLEKKDMFAIMIEQDDGTYAESNESEWPTDRVFNVDESGCVDSNGNTLDGSLTYDAANNQVKVRTNEATYCYLYFSLVGPDIKINNFDLTKLNTGKYIKSVDCGTTGSATFDTKYQRLEFNSIIAPAKCNINYTEDTTSYSTLKSVVEAKATTNANGYRYSGKNPDNYVWFNNEMWRIIGSIPTCTSSGCTTSENLVKIIRAESIGGLAYDAKSSEYTGAWGSNTLYSLLNTHYYASNSENMNGQSHAGCYGYSSTAKANCDYSGIGIDANSYYGKMVKNVYWNTGASSDWETAGAAYTNEIATQTVSGYIGLMSTSDYGYAADSSYHSTSMDIYDTAAITGTNWLYGQGYEWTNIQYSSDASYALHVNFGGYVFNYDACDGYSVRPVLYLDSSVYVISGEGTQASPYMIGM